MIVIFLSSFQLFKNSILLYGCVFVLASICAIFIYLFVFCRISGIYSDLKAVFEAADVPADISWWAINYGTEMPLTWPKFEVQL